ncbi:hypothetical protein A6E15_18940 [Natrinema saccharevitans]|uniref:Alcohol dehydrogenase-like C-terminal domain-containing protein n=1 Tax=Natrinema saccharevitans TaxID=301967 RepID=A0A1S8ARI5_9EURY|nr:zinc-binding dehydrogenase [Natrinema saccharevitans]OLZ39154.1 hypothetical protein A6E15_17230 [Natrinema saccharevitans]OLZ39438.1 hypothetical protein A6E15_18940 [Natrinema saccharevitans]
MDDRLEGSVFDEFDAATDHVHAVWECDKPVIAAVDGYCLAGGSDLAMASDLVIATEESSFGYPGLRMAGVPPTLVYPFVTNLHEATELLLSGKVVDAQRAAELGMVNRVVPRNRLTETVFAEVEEIRKMPGANVDDVRVGDRITLNMVTACHDCRYCADGKYHLCEQGDGGVVASRGFADRIVVPSSMAVPVPDEVSLRHAALAEPLGVSLRGVRRSGLEPTDRVAVFGAGPIGLGVVAGAAAAGAREIYVSEPRAARREAAAALGADVVIDPTAVDAVEEIQRDTDRVDVSFECAGTAATLTDALRSTAYGERVVVLSVFEEEVPIHPNDVMQAERELVGSFGFQGGPLASRSEFATALDYVADGRIDPEPMISGTVSLEETESAFEQLRDPDSDRIKVLVEP